MRSVLGVHSYPAADGSLVRHQATLRVGIKGHTLSALGGVGPAGSGATVAVACRTCAVRRVSLPFSDPKKAAQVVPFEVDGMVPFDVDGAVVSHELLAGSREQSRFLAAVSPLEAVGEAIDAYGGGGDQPQVILPEAVALFHFGRALCGDRRVMLLDLRPGRAMLVQIEAGTWLDSNTVSVAWQPGQALEKDDVLALRRGAHTLWTAHRTMPEAVLVVGELGEDGAALFAEALDLPRLAPAALAAAVPGMAIMDEDDIASHAVAIGLGLAAADGKRRMNLRGGPYALAHAAQGVALRRLAGVGVGLLIILALATGNAWVRHQLAQTALDESKAALVAQYRAVFPAAGKVVNPVKQAGNELKKLKAKALLYGTSGTTPLGYLNQISQTIPKALKLDVFEFSVEGTRLRMEAQAASFDAIDQIKSQLKSLPGIEQVQVSDAKMNAKGDRVKFRVHATLAEGV